MGLRIDQHRSAPELRLASFVSNIMLQKNRTDSAKSVKENVHKQVFRSILDLTFHC
jgi:hypothetical protein